MFLLFLLILVVAMVVISRSNTKTEPNPCEKKHTWVLRKPGGPATLSYLICAKCGKEPGAE